MDNQAAARLEAVANALQIQNFVEHIDEENTKRSREEIKESKELVSALRDLNKKISSVGKESSGEKNIFSSWIGEKIEPIKKLTSLQGITEVLAAKAGPGLTGTILGTAAEGMQARREEKQRKASFVSTVLEGTDVGRSWQKELGVEKASQIATEIYKEREMLEKKIAVLDKKEKAIQGDGSVEGAGLDQEDTEHREALKRKLQENKDFFKAKSPKDTEEKEEKSKSESFEKLRDEMIEGVRSALALDQQTQEHDDILEVRSETIGDALNELAEISESQLQELVRIADNFDKRELSEKEDLLERVKEKQNSLETLEKNESEKSNPMRNLLDKGLSILNKGKKAIPSLLGRGASALGGITKTVGTTIARTAPSVLRSLSPAGAVAAAGAGGYMFGKHAVNPALNAIAEKITGVEGETVGSALYDGVDKLAGSKLGNMLGFKSDAQKMEEAETKALVEIGKKRLAEGKTVTTNIANAMSKSGIEVSAEQISDKKPEAKPKTTQSENIEAKQSENELPKKQETRVQITDAVERAVEQVDQVEKTKNTSVVNAPTVVNNSTNNTTITHKQLRNTEPSYVTGMNRKLVF